MLPSLPRESLPSSHDRRGHGMEPQRDRQKFKASSTEPIDQKTSHHRSLKYSNPCLFGVNASAWTGSMSLPPRKTEYLSPLFWRAGCGARQGVANLSWCVCWMLVVVVYFPRMSRGLERDTRSWKLFVWKGE